MKVYIQPNLRIVDLTSEGVIAGSPTSLNVDTSEENSVTTEWSEKKSEIWESEGIWK